MNKFRNYLHPAFFNTIETGPNTPEQSPESVNLTQLKEHVAVDLVKETNEYLTDELNPNNNPDLLRQTYNNDIARYQADYKRFSNRYRDNKDIWETKIKTGLGFLITELSDNNYFKDANGRQKSKEEIQKECEKIKNMYLQEVKKQLIKKVRFSGDKKFDREKNTIFGRESGKNYPANKIYCELTGAETIFAVERRARRSTIDAAALTRGSQVAVGEQAEATESQNGEIETINRQDRKFLSNDLPEYLWDIRKTPWALKALSILPIFSVKEDRPSLVDRDAIDDFLKVASKLTLTENSPYKNKDAAVALFEMLEKNSDLNVNNPDKFREKLREYGLQYKEKDFDDILRVGAFYIRTQADGLAPEDQHPIYLSVLEIIRQKGSVKNAVKDLKSLVENAKTEKKNERKQGYESGEAIEGEGSENYKGLAQKLGITDLRSATRLRKLAQDKNSTDESAKQKADAHFGDKVTALADLDNNGIIDPKDIARGGTNTGMQFQEMCKLIGENKALENLINRAKLQNAALNLGLNESEITAEAISNGNPSVILLLQDIISKPGQDLYSLLSGESTREIIENDEKLMNECNALAAKFLSEGKINKKGIREWLEEQKQKTDNNLDDFTNFASLQSSLATFLYDNYKIGVGVGSTMSLDQWAKGLEIGTGIQFRDGGKAALGMAVTYKKNIDLGKGWTLTPALSAGAFLPIASGSDKDIGASMSLGTALDRKTINVDKHITRHQGGDLGVSYVIGSGVVAYLGYHNTRDRAEDIDVHSAVESTRFTENTMSGILDEIINTQQGKLMLSGEENNLDKITAIIDEKIKNLEGDKGELKANIIRLLAKYNGETITQSNKAAILAGIRTDYERLRSESHKDEISKGLYFSGYSAGVYGGVGGIGVYVAGQATKHDLDAYGDVEGRSHELDNGEKEVWDNGLIQKLNERLGLVGNEQIKFDENSIVIPKGVAYMARVSESVKGLMVKEENGDIRLSKRTPMHENIKVGTSTKTVELLIGEGEDSEFENHLDAIDNTRFASDISTIDSKILEKRNAQLYTTEKLTEKVAGLGIAQSDLTKVVGKISTEIEKLSSKDKELKITITKLANSDYNVNITQGNPGSKVEMILMEAKELFDSAAKQEAQKVYNWAAEQQDPTALYKIKHPHPGIREYQNFASALYEGNFTAAKDSFNAGIKDKLPGFPNINWHENDEAALGQLLMSINNIFARAKTVIGKGSEDAQDVTINTYEIGGKYRNFGEIIGKRADQIKRTIEGKQSIDNEIKIAYVNCIGAMEAVREENNGEDSRYSQKQHNAASLHNTVGFNLGDKTNPENPLLGVEVYDNVMDATSLDGKGEFTAEMRQQLHKHAMEEFIKNKALFDAIGKTIGKTHEQISELLGGAQFELDGNTGKLRLDFSDGKYIVLKADMKLGYYTQCVNHTVILDNISVEADGNVVSFGSGAWENGQIQSTTAYGVVAREVYSAGLSMGISNEGKKGSDNTAAASDRADDGGKQPHTGDGQGTGATPTPVVNTDPTTTDTGGEEA